MKNSTKVWLAIGGLSLLQLFVGLELGGRLGLFIGFCSSLVFILILLAFRKPAWLKQLESTEVRGQDAYSALELIHQFSERAGLKKPKVFFVNVSLPTSFVYSHPVDRASIYISESCFSFLTRAELEALFARSVCLASHLQNPVPAFFQMILTSTCEFLSWLDSTFLFKRKVFTQLSALPVSVFSQFILSSKNSLDIDDASANLARDRKHLALALWKLESALQHSDWALPVGGSHLFITSNKQGKSKGLAYHGPELSLRIKRLVGYFPL
jgi:heat shock protein HtpX